MNRYKEEKMKININEFFKKFEESKEKLITFRKTSSFMRYKDDIDKIVELCCELGWFDWFCKDSSLAGKTISLAGRLSSIRRSPKFNCNKTYVFFKNNRSFSGNLFDDFRICDIETEKVIYTIIPSALSSFSEVWGIENNFIRPIITGTWNDVLQFFEIKK